MVWDLRGREPHHQTTLPHPSTHLVVEEGGAWLYGPLRERFERTLAGRGRAVGLRFRPGGLRPLLRAPVSSIRDRRLPASTLPGLDGDALTRAVEAADELEQAVAAMEAALEPLLPAEPDPESSSPTAPSGCWRRTARSTACPTSPERLSLSVRSVQRLFADHVGLGAVVGDPPLPAARGGRAGHGRAATSTGRGWPSRSATTTRRTSCATSRRRSAPRPPATRPRQDQ